MSELEQRFITYTTKKKKNSTILLWHTSKIRGNDWLAEELCPRLTSNHVLILDNASLHKTPRTRELIESSGASLMFLPPYSPDYNPIEHDFANIKRHREYHPERTLHDIIQMYK